MVLYITWTCVVPGIELKNGSFQNKGVRFLKLKGNFEIWQGKNEGYF